MSDASELSNSELGLVDVPPSEEFDRFTRLCAALFDVPVALISIVETDKGRQYFSSCHGLAEPWATARQTPLSHSFCQYVQSRNVPLRVRDAREDALLCTNRAVAELDVIAYLGVPLFGPDGNVLGALCVIDNAPRDWRDDDVARLTDVAACVSDTIALRATRIVQDRRQDDFRRQEADFEALFANVPDVISVAEMDTTIRMVNPAYEEMMGAPASELIGQNFLAQIPSEQQEEFLSRLESCTPETPFMSNLQSWIADGVTRSTYWTNVAVFEGDIPKRIISIGRDVTELHAAKVLAEEKASEAERANRAQANFLANMSHELRTPLNGVIGLSASLAASEMDEEHKRVLGVISGAGRHLLSLLDDVMDYTKVEAETFALDADTFRPYALIDETVALLQLQAQAKGMQIEAHFEVAAEAEVRGNETRIRQVITNLVCNALKFADTGVVSVAVRLVGDRALVMEITDQGPGVPDDQKEAIFIRFRQGAHTEDQHAGGIGLGLAISRRICEHHGGRLFVRDAPGGGATFVAEVAVQCLEETDTDAARDTITRPLRLLVADDNAVNRLVMKKYLSQWPIDAVYVKNGKDALDALAHEAFDGALIDVRMPVMDGLECVRRLRSVEAAQEHLPIVACTANVMPAQLAEYRDVGFDQFLPKPVNRVALQTCLSWISRQSNAATHS